MYEICKQLFCIICHVEVCQCCCGWAWQIIRMLWWDGGGGQEKGKHSSCSWEWGKAAERCWCERCRCRSLLRCSRLVLRGMVHMCCDWGQFILTLLCVAVPIYQLFSSHRSMTTFQVKWIKFLCDITVQWHPNFCAGECNAASWQCNTIVV